MDSVTHVVMGIGLGGLAHLHTSVATDPVAASAVMVATVVGSQLPDSDIVSRFHSKHAYMRHHRGRTHGMPFAVLWTVLLGGGLALAYPSVSPALLFLWSGIAVFFHIFIDLFNGYGTQVLWPWRTTWVAWDIIPIFDPFLFSSHIVAIVLWIFGVSSPAVIFGTLYSITALYMIARTVQHHIVRTRVVQRHVTTEGCHVAVLPSWFLFRWYVIIRRPDRSYTLGLWQRDTLGFVQHHVPHENEWTSLSISSPVVSALLSFSRFPHVETERIGHDTIVWWQDMRYKLLQPYPLVAVVRYDHDRNACWSDIGWMSRSQVLHRSNPATTQEEAGNPR